MARTSLKRMRTFIEMYNMQDVLTVRKCSDDDPADRYELGQVVEKGYQVELKVGEDDYIYLCKTLTAAGECVTKLVFNLPIDGEELPAT
jgi:hypothetical protein